MSSFSRFSAIFFAVVLTSISISKHYYGELLNIRLQGAAAGHHQSELTEKILNDAFCIYQKGEQVLSSVTNLPAPHSKIFSDLFLYASIAAEQRMQNIGAQYIFKVKKINPGLSIGAIIFPFHYFW